MKYISGLMKNKEKILLLTILAFIWVYLWLKAYYVPLVNDELGTFYFYVQPKKILPFIAHWDANNHILHSAFTTLFYTLFGASEIALRLTSLLSFPVFFFYCIRISNKLNNKIVIWSFIITLCFTHNFIEFFFLSRGYGMSMALLFGSIYYLMQALGNSLRKDYIKCVAFGILAVVANLTLVNSFLIILFILFVNIFIRFKEQKSGKNILLLTYIFLIGIIPLIFLSKYMMELKNRDLLYYGNLKGFFEVTIKSLSGLITGSSGNIYPYIFVLFFLIVTILFFVVLIKNKFRKIILDKHNTFYLLLILNIAAIFVLAKLFKVNYPEDRTGIYLYPFLIGSLCFMIDYLIIKTNKKLFFALLLPFTFFPVNFLYSMNLTHSALYYDDRIPKRYFEKIYSEHKDGEFPASIGAYRCRHFSWDYMNYRHKGNLGVINEWDYPEIFSEFQICDINKCKDWKKYYDGIDYDDVTKYYLLKRKHFLEKKLIDKKSADANGEISGEFYNVYEQTIDSLTGNLLYIGYKLTINSDAAPFNSRIVTEIRDEKDQKIIYKSINLNGLKLNYDGTLNNFINGFYINKLPANAHKIISYIWDIDKKPYSVKGSCYLYKVITDY
ncbi:MAG: hypothetical protein WC599_03270 [Bacteroidales bacterium]